MKTQIKYALASLALMLSTGAFSQTLADAIKLTDNEQYEKAKGVFLQLLAKEPTNGDNYYYFSELMLKTEDLDSACILSRKGLSINPTNPLVHIGVARCELMKGNVDAGNKELAQATSLIDTQTGKKGAFTNQKAAEMYVEVSETYYRWSQKPDPDKGIAMAQKAETLDPKSANAVIAHGDALLVKDPVNGTEPLALYEKAGSFDPTSCKAWVRIGDVYKNGKNMPKAISYYNKAISIEPNFGPAYRGRGESQYQIGKTDSAAASFKKYLELNNDCYSRYRYSAFLYLSKDYDNAIKEGEAVIACDSNKVSVIYRIVALSYYEKPTPEPDKAIQFMTLFLNRAKPDRITADDYITRGRAYSKNKQDSLALFDYRRALAVDTSRKDIYFDFATSYFKLKKYDSAAVYYQKKIDSSVKPGLNDWYALGQAYYYAKDYANADSAFKKVTIIDPKNPMGWLWRGKSNASLDKEAKYDYARQYYETYFDLAIVDKEKNKKELINAARYLAGYHYIHKNFACSKAYFQFVLDLDPTAEDVKKQLTTDKDLKAATAADLGTCKLPASGTK